MRLHCRSLFFFKTNGFSPQKCSHPILLTSQKVWAPFLLSLCSKQIHSSHSFTCSISPTFMLKIYCVQGLCCGWSGYLLMTHPRTTCPHLPKHAHESFSLRFQVSFLNRFVGLTQYFCAYIFSLAICFTTGTSCMQSASAGSDLQSAPCSKVL